MTAGGTEQEVLAGIRDMYAAFLDGDRARFDRHLDPTTTTWETHLPRLFDRGELDDHRDRRPVASSRVAELRVEPQQVDVWDDVAVARYLLLVARSTGAAAEVTRVTDVLRRRADGWRIVHHHAEQMAGAHGAR
ncbi:nuclear transport factor 2 family protein [Pseudonocardia sichuanensis]